MLLLCECSLSGGNTLMWWGHLNPTCCSIIYLNILNSHVFGIEKHSARALTLTGDIVPTCTEVIW